MVKRGGRKRKIPMEKIKKKESLATAFTKRTSGIFSKASQLCLLSGAQIAVLATPPTSQSNVSFYSFGHSSVDGLVSAFLNGQRPVPVPEKTTMEEEIGICLARKDLGLEMWWEDEHLARSENPQELTDAINSMSRMLKTFKEYQRDHHQQDEYLKNNDLVLHRGTQTQNLQSNPDTDFNKISEDQDL